MSKEHSKEHPSEQHHMSLTADQKVIYDAFITGTSFCITGPGGCGKSFIISYIRRNNLQRNIAVTALTGTAACLIGGQTLHGWGGLGLAKDTAEDIVRNIYKYRPQIVKRWKETDTLIVDEMSMMSAELFNKIEKIARLFRNNDKFFGGIQLIPSGDFAQLEPIESDRYCFESKKWVETFDVKNTYYLDQVLRQDDPVYVKLLSEIRLGKVTDETRTILRSRFITDESEADIVVADANGNLTGATIKATVLFPMKCDVKRINDSELAKLLEKSSQSQIQTYAAIDTCTNKKTKVSSALDSKKRDILNKAMNAVESIKLATGAQVMLIKNKSIEDGLVNGSRGVVTAVSEVGPTVLFDNGEELQIVPETFEMDGGDVMLSRTQVPLILAWAMTIHKCQGATLTNVITDLKDMFGYGQAYVTLSRVKSIEGLFIINIDFRKIRCNPKVVEYYSKLVPIRQRIEHPIGVAL